MSNGIYNGRLMADGSGKLLADQSRKIGDRDIVVHDDRGEPVLDDNGQAIIVKVPVMQYGDDHGREVRAHEGSYIFLDAGEPSHNDVHHKQFAQSDRPSGETSDVIEATVDESMTDDETLVNVGDGVNEHHFGVLPDDAHYDPDAPNQTRLRFHNDRIAHRMASHTDAPKQEDQ